MRTTQRRSAARLRAGYFVRQSAAGGVIKPVGMLGFGEHLLHSTSGWGSGQFIIAGVQADGVSIRREWHGSHRLLGFDRPLYLNIKILEAMRAHDSKGLAVPYLVGGQKERVQVQLISGGASSDMAHNDRSIRWCRWTWRLRYLRIAFLFSAGADGQPRLDGRFLRARIASPETVVRRYPQPSQVAAVSLSATRRNGRVCCRSLRATTVASNSTFQRASIICGRETRIY